jgi:hypothetical protein
MSDIIERLRDKKTPYSNYAIIIEAADKIERLTAERDLLLARKRAQTALHVEIENLTAESAKSLAYAQARNGEIENLLDENEKLTAERDRLRAVLIELLKYKWKSVDRDNMEFNATITCFTMDKMLALAEVT